VAAASVSVMDVVEVAALVLAALEVTPSEPADLTPLVRDRRGFQSLVSAHRSTGSLALAEYLADSIDHHRVEHWTAVLRHDVLETRRYRILLAGHDDYPGRLNDVWDAAPLLFMRGSLASETAPAVAIVGSRSTSDATLTATEELAFELADQGVDIVSGLALGVDGAAHRGALRSGGRTTAVLGTGIETNFPAQHAGLAAEIGTRGALISQFPPRAPHTSTSFLRRNGTIAALCDMLVVMDAASRSGSRQAVRRAVEYHRPVMMWEPTLGRDTWAKGLVDSGQGQFFSEPAQMHDALRKVAL